jgi:hypothetical protein
MSKVHGTEVGRLLLVHDLNKQKAKRDSMGDLRDLSEMIGSIDSRKKCHGILSAIHSTIKSHEWFNKE